MPIFAEHVPKALTGEADFERALRKLRRLINGPLCITLGARGAPLLDGDAHQRRHSRSRPLTRPAQATSFAAR